MPLATTANSKAAANSVPGGPLPETMNERDTSAAAAVQPPGGTVATVAASYDTAPPSASNAASAPVQTAVPGQPPPAAAAHPLQDACAPSTHHAGLASAAEAHRLPGKESTQEATEPRDKQRAEADEAMETREGNAAAVNGTSAADAAKSPDPPGG